MQIVIYGPQACGKTRNKEALAKHFGCDQVIDDWEPGDPLPDNALALTNSHKPPVGAVPFAVAMALADMSKTITLPDLQEGERYAGLILDEEGAPTHHLILLPGDVESMTFDAATEWATTIGGELPTRSEQSLLYSNCKNQFQGDWYWSGTQHAANSGHAWCQNFNHGNQLHTNTSAELRARAVRRLPI